MAKPLISARHGAHVLLMQVLGAQRPMSEAVTRIEALSPPERAAAQRLATETLRHLERADVILKPHLNRKPPLPALALLQLATVELCQGGAAHGVVHDAVEIAQAERGLQRFKGLVNAVLRKVSHDGAERFGALRPARLPRWLRGPLTEAWGKQAMSAMERAHASAPPLDLTAKGDPQALADATGGILLPTGSVRLKGGQVSALPGYDDGAFWVQDAAAALPAKLLGDVRGQKVLDMCAAPGGKTLQLAASGAEVTALDLSPARLERVRENLTRTGLSAHLVGGDVFEHHGTYDAVLLDAPCSATGTIRRHPDLPHLHQGERISELIAQQASMLDHALHLLRPGGMLVFATCSLIPDEGECQIEELLARQPQLEVLDITLPGVAPGWRSAEGGLRLRPDYWADLGGMDGFYMAALQKPA